MAEIVQAYRIPEKLLTDVIDGVEMDLAPQPFQTCRAAKLLLSRRGAVGLCCIRIWGYRGDEAEAAAIDCGVASN